MKTVAVYILSCVIIAGKDVLSLPFMRFVIFLQKSFLAKVINPIAIVYGISMYVSIVSIPYICRLFGVNFSFFMLCIPLLFSALNSLTRLMQIKTASTFRGTDFNKDPGARYSFLSTESSCNWGDLIGVLMAITTIKYPWN